MLMSMATGTLISVEKYLNTSYSPDREYVDGEILERNVGEKEHSKLQMALLMLLAKHGYPKGFKIWPEQRVQVRATRFRIPDVCVTVGEPDEPVFTTPPLICIEILSKDDSLIGLQEKIDDYLDFGVPHIWLFNPKNRKAYTCDRDGIHEAKDARLAAGELILDLREIFEA